MGLTLITGGSGAGKTYRLFEKIIEQSMREPRRRFLVIVPEQSTMQAQRDLIRQHPRHGIMNIDVLSFNRLAYRVFAETGNARSEMLEEIGKTFILEKIALDMKKKLPYYGEMLAKPAHIAEMKSVISELMLYDITPDMLRGAVTPAEEAAHTSFAMKMKDTAAVYSAFISRLAGSYYTAEEVPDRLSRIISESSLVRGAVVALDGFTGFTPVQFKLIGKMMPLVSELYVTLTMDPDENPFARVPESELFALSHETAGKLRALAEDAGVPVRRPWTAARSASGRYAASPALSRLEQMLFRSRRKQLRFAAAGQRRAENPKIGEVRGDSRAAQPESAGGKIPDFAAGKPGTADGDRGAAGAPESIKIYEAEDPGRETEAAALQISRWVREDGLRYGDIAVVTGDLETYGSYARRVFARWDIPVFVDTRRSILKNPCVEYLRAALEAVTEDYSYESIFRMLKSGMADFTAAETEHLENYVLGMGIRGKKRWREKFVRGYAGEDPGEIPVLDGVRARVTALLDPLAEAFGKRGGTVREKTEALYDFCVRSRLEEKMDAYVLAFGGGESAIKSSAAKAGADAQTGDAAAKAGMDAENAEAGDAAAKSGASGENVKTGDAAPEAFPWNAHSGTNLALAREYAQVYPAVMDFLDKLVGVLGDEKISMRDYRALIEAGFAETKVAVIPPGADQVIVGDMERSRIANARALIFLGVNEGLIPKTDDGGGALSEADRRKLHARKISLKPSAREAAYIGRLYIYLAMTKPSDKLCLMYSTRSGNGEARRPSYIIDSVRRIFPEIQIGTENPDPCARFERPAPGFSLLAEGLETIGEKEPGASFRQLFSWYKNNPEFSRETALLLAAAGKHSPAGQIGRAAAAALYGENLRGSASRLERFFSCEFAHFLQFGLRLKERPDCQFNPMDRGNILHRALELYVRHTEESGTAWSDLAENEDLRNAAADAGIEAAVSESGVAEMYDTARSQYEIERLSRLMRQTAAAVARQIAAGDFRPAAVEIDFSKLDGLDAVTYSLPGGGTMSLTGRIDRVDTFENEGRTWVAITDYKTGSKEFSLTEVLGGRQLQLVMYMNAVMEMLSGENRNPQPAAMFYYLVNTPMVTVKPGSSVDIDSEIMKKLRPSGVVLADLAALRHFDHDLENEGGSTVIPVRLKKDGSFYKGSKVLTDEQFRTVCVYVRHKILEAGEKILQGEARINPAKDGGSSACDFCEYQGICGIDPRIPGYVFRVMRKMSDDEVTELMERVLHDENDGTEGR